MIDITQLRHEGEAQMGRSALSENNGANSPDATVPSTPQPNIICPHCKEGLFVEAAGVVGKNQRLSITMHPLSGERMIQAEALCGQVRDLDKIMQEIAKQDGGKVRSYVERIGMTDEGAFQFDLAVLPIRKATTPQQTELPLASAIEAASAGETAQTGSTEGESAARKGDAQ